MPVYEYIALDVRGQRKKGVVEAETASHARHKLRANQIYPIKIEELKEKKGKASYREILRNAFTRVRPQELAAVTRQLSTLIGAGLPLVTSLNVLASQITDGPLRKVLIQIKDAINEGNSLTNSISQFPHVFNPFYINMVRAGEMSGTLDLVLDRLAEYLERQEALKSKIRSALAYPVLMFFIGSVVLFFLVSFVVPNITKIFQDMHQRLPMFTVILIATSSFLKNYWWMLLAAAIGTLVFIRNFLATRLGRRLWDDWKMKIPVVGQIILHIYLARFGRTLGTLLQSDVPLIQALEIVRHVINNEIFSEEIKKAISDVEEGRGLAQSLSQSDKFPPLVMEMVAVGEQSGSMEKMLFRIADAFEREVEMKIGVFTSLLEPIMILIMGVLVGFIVISILLPIFEMNRLIR